MLSALCWCRAHIHICTHEFLLCLHSQHQAPVSLSSGPALEELGASRIWWPPLVIPWSVLNHQLRAVLDNLKHYFRGDYTRYHMVIQHWIFNSCLFFFFFFFEPFPCLISLLFSFPLEYFSNNPLSFKPLFQHLASGELKLKNISHHS